MAQIVTRAGRCNTVFIRGIVLNGLEYILTQSEFVAPEP